MKLETRWISRGFRKLPRDDQPLWKSQEKKRDNESDERQRKMGMEDTSMVSRYEGTMVGRDGAYQGEPSGTPGTKGRP